MSENPLKVVATDNSKSTPPKQTTRSARVELQAKLERQWLTDPQQFDPTRNNIERERIERAGQILHSLNHHVGPAVDLGCGYGYITRKMHQLGWQTRGVDIANNALKAFAEKGDEGIQLSQDALPSTKLDDDAYELVVCTDVIGYLEQRDYRLLMAELSRLVKRDGYVICSTAIDIDSEDALPRFGELAETEFQIERWHFCHHLLLIRFKHFFEAPAEYISASNDPEKRRQELNKRKGIIRWSYKLCTSKVGRLLWHPLAWISKPIVHVLRQNRSLMLSLEKVCRFFWDTSGISHATFVAKRRPLILPTKADLESVEPKGKRQVWE